MDQNAKRIGLINWVIMLVACIGMLLISRFVNSAAGAVGTALAGFGLLVTLLSYFQMRLEEREQFERLEMEELSRARGSESLFKTADADSFPARRSREQFDRYFVPAFTAILFLLQGATAYWPWKLAAAMPPIIPDKATLAMALLGLFGLILFLLGKYSSGLARLQGLRLLRPGAAYLLLSAYVCFVVTASIGAFLAGFVKADLIVARVLCVVSGLIAVETLLGLIFEIYRVRVKGKESRVLYESRLVGLLGQPEAIITTAAHALDYQFGFKVSETWFYRFLEKALAWLVLAQLGVLLLSTCVVFVEPGQQALLERFGAPVRGREVLGPGLHFKLPWPIDKARPQATERIQTFIIGSEPETNQIVLWSQPHAKEEDFVVATRDRSAVTVTNESDQKSPPVNLLAVSIPIQYQITNLPAWTYINEDPEELLRKLSTREIVHYLASADLDELMSIGRGQAAGVLHERIQAAADAQHLGALITFVGLGDIHPPVKVAKDYEQFVGAAQGREAKILEAQAYALKTNAQARAEAVKISNDADAARHRSVTNSAARALLFASQSEAYDAAPLIYKERTYLQALITGSRGARKYVIASTNTPGILMLDLQDKINPDFMIDKVPLPKQ